MLTRLFYGDKQTFPFGFNATGISILYDLRYATTIRLEVVERTYTINRVEAYVNGCIIESKIIAVLLVFHGSCHPQIHPITVQRCLHLNHHRTSCNINVRAGTPYALAPKSPFDIGRAIAMPDGSYFFGTNTVAPRHPITGEPVWLHRHAPKFVWTHDYLKFDPVPRAWTHIAKQNPYGSWRGVLRDTPNIPLDIFLPSYEHQLFVDVHWLPLSYGL